MAAFKSVALALGSRCMAFYADSDEVDAEFWRGRSQWDCIELLERMWGPPQPNIEELDSRLNEFMVWFLEDC